MRKKRKREKKKEKDRTGRGSDKMKNRRVQAKLNRLERSLAMLNDTAICHKDLPDDCGVQRNRTISPTVKSKELGNLLTLWEDCSALISSDGQDEGQIVKLISLKGQLDSEVKKLLDSYPMEEFA